MVTLPSGFPEIAGKIGYKEVEITNYVFNIHTPREPFKHKINIFHIILKHIIYLLQINELKYFG